MNYLVRTWSKITSTHTVYYLCLNYFARVLVPYADETTSFSTVKQCKLYFRLDHLNWPGVICLTLIYALYSCTDSFLINAPWYVTNETIHRDLKIPAVKEEIYKSRSRYNTRVNNHHNLLVTHLLDFLTTWNL